MIVRQDVLGTPDANPFDNGGTGIGWLPNTFDIPMAGDLSGAPGGGAPVGYFVAGDATQNGGVYFNPNLPDTGSGGQSSGAWDFLGKLLNTSLGAFQQYEKGSPSVATPPPANAQIPTGGPYPNPQGGTTVTLPWSGSGLLIIGGLGLALALVLMHG